jgi:DegV family protein with EDD domain
MREVIEVSEIAVMTDTVSYMPQELGGEYHISQIPTHIVIDGETHLENELDLATLYAKMPKWKQQNNLPSTSSPSPDDFVKAYRQLAKDHKSIIYLGYSKHLGMTVNSALLAKDLVKDELANTDIEVMDTKSWGGAQMLVTIEVARAVSAGKNLEEVLRVAGNMISKVKLVILSDNLYYLAKGGRIHKARPWSDSKISNTVLLGLDSSTDGQTTPVARCRTKGEALKRLFGLVQDSGANSKLHIAINHADALAEAEQLKEKAISQFKCAEVFVSNIGPLVTIHTGLGTRAFSWWYE